MACLKVGKLQRMVIDLYLYYYKRTISCNDFILYRCIDHIKEFYLSNNNSFQYLILVIFILMKIALCQMLLIFLI